MPDDGLDSKQRYKKKNRELGLCITCAAPAAPGSPRCERHRKKQNEASLRHKRRREEAGRCFQCGRPQIDEVNSCYCSINRREQAWN